MKILSVDLGTVHTGFAVCDENEMIVTPLKVISETDIKKLALIASEIAKKNIVSEIVIGLPLNMDGTRGESCLRIESFAKKLKRASHLPVSFHDERLSTVGAYEIFDSVYDRTTDKRKHNRKLKENIDSYAAAVILEEYISNRSCSDQSMILKKRMNKL